MHANNSPAAQITLDRNVRQEVVYNNDKKISSYQQPVEYPQQQQVNVAYSSNQQPFASNLQQTYVPSSQPYAPILSNESNYSVDYTPQPYQQSAQTQPSPGYQLPFSNPSVQQQYTQSMSSAANQRSYTPEYTQPQHQAQHQQGSNPYRTPAFSGRYPQSVQSYDPQQPQGLVAGTGVSYNGVVYQ